MARRRNTKGRFIGFGRKSRKHARRHGRRGLRGLGDMPSMDTLKSNVGGHDVLMGAGIGLLGVLAVNMYVNKEKQQSWNNKFRLNPFQGAASALVGAVAAGALAYAFLHKDDKAKNNGWMIGATGAGLAVMGSRLLDAGYVSKNGYYGQPGVVFIKPGVSLALPGGTTTTTTTTTTNGYGMLVPSNRPMGMLVSDNKRRTQGLAALSMALDAADSMSAIM